MRNWVKNLMLVGLLVLGGPRTALALSGNIYNMSASVGFCQVELSVDSSYMSRALVMLHVGTSSSWSAAYAGGSLWQYGGTAGSGPAVTLSDIEYCLSASSGSVTNFVANGADGSSLQLEDYLGFRFDYAGNRYEYAVSGVSNTQAITTVTALDITPPAVTLTSDAANPQTGPFTLSVTFSEPVTGFTAGDITLSNGTLGTLSGSGASYTIMVTPAQMGTPVVISVAAGVAQDGANNLNTAATNLTVSTGSPSSAFEAAADQIRQVLAEEATRTLSSTIASNQRMSRDARERFIAAQSGEADGAGDVPLDVEGGVDTTDTVISSKGTFFGQTSLAAGNSRLVFGDFDVQHDSETGSSTATLNGKVAWETVVSDKMTLGYFVGGELARSNIMGSFEGDQNRVGLSVGGYAVEEFAENVYLDGFFSLGAGRNNLTMSNGALDLDSDYTTRTATLGAALSAVIEQKGFEIWPELSFSYGRTWLGNVGFTGTAYSMTDNTLSLDAGTVTLANIMFRPEFRVPMDGLSGAESLQLFTFAPRLICEQITTDTVEENCGGGAELGVTAQSENGLSNVSAKLMADRLGDRTSSSLQLNLERRL